MNHDTTGVTPTFNEAAGGPSGEASMAEETGPHDLGGDGAAEDSASKELSAIETKNSTEASMTTQFSEAAETPEAADWEAEAEEEEAAEEAPEPPLSLKDAEAELAELEAGRPKPTPTEDFKPDPHLVQIVHTQIEQDRENRIAALSAYLEFSRSGPEHAAEHDFDDAPEPAL